MSEWLGERGQGQTRAKIGVIEGHRGPLRVSARVSRHRLRLGSRTLAFVGARPEDARTLGARPEPHQR